MIKAVGDNVIVELTKAPQGLIYTKDEAQENGKKYGTVVSVSLAITFPHCKVGDNVVLRPFGSRVSFVHDEATYIAVPSSDIIAVLS